VSGSHLTCTALAPRPWCWPAPIGAPGSAWVPFQVPALVEAGFRVVTFNPRGVPPSQVPPPPYSVADMAADAAALVVELASGPSR
jgi:pimeloyl-ACP methyl ester carboxylesterase